MHSSIQEVFRVYLIKFKNAVSHLFLFIFGNNLFPWVSLISRNTQLSRKQYLILIFWFETVSEDTGSYFAQTCFPGQGKKIFLTQERNA